MFLEILENQSKKQKRGKSKGKLLKDEPEDTFSNKDEAPVRPSQKLKNKKDKEKKDKEGGCC